MAFLLNFFVDNFALKLRFSGTREVLIEVAGSFVACAPFNLYSSDTQHQRPPNFFHDIPKPRIG